MHEIEKINECRGMAGAECHALVANFDGLEKLSVKEKRQIFGNSDVVMTGFAGLAGSVILTEKREEELRSRYSAAFIERVKNQKRIIRQEPFSFSEGITGLYRLSKGGVFAGLWNMAKEACVGLEADLKKIPVKQETIEVCNFFDINPYLLYSEGSCLLLTENGGRLKARLHKMGICSEVIGYTTEKNDRIVTNGEDTRFLEKNYEEELYKVLKQ